MKPAWKGNITFGLVNISVLLFSAEKPQLNHFKLIDSRDKAHIKYQRINEKTGKEVPWDKITKAYEYQKNYYLEIKPDEIQSILPEKTQAINIERFIKLEDLPIIDFQKPYYIVPEKKFEKGYVILREILDKTGTTGIAKVVIHNLEHLVAVVPYENALILEILRYQSDLVPLDQFDFPSDNLKQYKISNKEIETATRLVKSMQTKWAPGIYKNDYHRALQKWAERKIKHKKPLELAPEKNPPKTSNIIDFVEILQKSIKKSSPKTTHKRTPHSTKTKTSHRG